jgi:trimethylamine-N-oxide reductase (cytochrome c), cytochrome c-type subunit TorC
VAPILRAAADAAKQSANRVYRLWRWLWLPSRFALGAILIVGGIGGVVFWGGFNTFMEYTNTLGFCISCHEMESTVYQEYKETIHYSNRTGVRAVCSDCHVPKEWVPKLKRKIYATRELFYWAMGSIDTPEKFEAARLEMAERVWATMKANDSHECRNCHTYGAMNFELQHENAQNVMKAALAEGRTCIECHKGIVHQLPDLMFSFKGNLADETVEPSQTVSVGPRAVEMTNADGTLLATLMPGTQVKIVETEADRVRVQLEAWAQDVYPVGLMKAVGERILFAELTKPGLERRTAIDQFEDPYGERWDKVRIDGWVKKLGLALESKVVWDLADRIYSSRCGSCHAPHATTEFTANQWPGNLDAMADYGGLMDEQFALVKQHLQVHAKPPLLQMGPPDSEEEADDQSDDTDG